MRTKTARRRRPLIAALGITEGYIPVQRISEWFQVLTNVGVIIGLLLVAFQIEQTNQSLELERSQWTTEFRTDRHEMLTAPVRMIAADEQLTDLWRKGLLRDDLTEEEAFRFRMIADQYMWGVWNVFMNTMDWEPDGRAGSVYLLAEMRQQYPGLKNYSDEWIARYENSLFAATLADIEAKTRRESE
jgi:hypothetical protein